MHYRAPLATLLLTIVLSAASNSQFRPMSAFDRTPGSTGSLSGKVVTADGQPAAGVRVELRMSNSLGTAAVAYTQKDGSFEMYNIPMGEYGLAALAGVDQVENHVSVGLGPSSVEVRLPRASMGMGGTQDTVSVAEIMVPEKARSFYRKAREAAAKGKLDDANKLVSRALEKYPHYANALLLRGVLEMHAASLQLAQQDFEQAIQYDPSLGAAYTALAAVYNNQGKFDDALRVSERGTTLTPGMWQGYYEEAKASLGKGMYQKALQLAEKAEKLGGSNFAALHLVKAYALVPLRLYRNASQELQAFLSREPKGSNAEQAQGLLARIDVAQGTGVGAMQ